jgi:predicted RNase H-like HicB family nuclease
MKSLELNNIIYKEGKYYVAQCLNVDVSSFGKTRLEALDNLQEALELYFEEDKTPAFSKIQHAEIVVSKVKYA